LRIVYRGKKNEMHWSSCGCVAFAVPERRADEISSRTNFSRLSLPSSGHSQTTTDPHTGKQTTKTSLGGAYPGQRQQNATPYTPDASQFGANGQATAHFKAVGGGNALTLVQHDGTPVAMQVAPQYIQGTWILLTCRRVEMTTMT
jgi:hypothetical protein